MAAIASDLTIVVFGCLLALWLIVWRTRVPKGLSLPPGPPAHPLFGNAGDMPINHQWETFTRWSQEFGALVSVTVFGQRMIIVNSLEVAHDLFDKKSTLYSDRIEFTMLNDLMGFSWNLGLQRYGERWRRHRRMLHQGTHSTAAAAYHSIHTKQTRSFLRRLYQCPDAFMSHLHHLAGASIVEIVYGIKVQPTDDHYTALAGEVTRALMEAAQPGAFLVDMFPALKYIPEWVPGAGFRRKARIWRGPITELCVAPFEAVKQSLRNGTAKPSMMASLLEKFLHRPNARPDEGDIIRNVAAVAYMSGADTTSTALAWFILAMVLYPDVQRKAQSELNDIIGPCRLPEFEDRESLPYIRALCKEIHRWHPVGPLALPHRVTQDDVYGNYFIPRGSVIIGNSWAILHDETVYGPATDSFCPDRFLDPNVPDPTSAFGFGRRICPGRFLADNSIFIAVASILMMFNISPAQDSIGNDIPIHVSSTSGAISRPEAFQCAFTPRSDTAALLLRCNLDGDLQDDTF